MEKAKLNIICSSLLILNGVFLLICPLLSWTNFELLFSLSYGFMAIVYGVMFLSDMKSVNYPYAFNSLISLAMGIFGLALNITEISRYFAIALLFFTMAFGLVKLKKADIYHDRKSKLWMFQVALLVIFVISGIVTSVNFLYGVLTHILLFGYFILLTGILEFVENFILYLTKGKLK